MTRIRPCLERSIEELINLVTKMYWVPAILLQSSQECSAPESLSPLLSLIDSLTTLAFLAGVGLGVLGFSAAAISIMMPGEEWTRRGKRLARHVFVGVILLLAAPMIVDYLVASLGEGAFCQPESPSGS
ncbi:hypothetical protein BRD19_09865 [Halobacteriales archaeon SW_7_65_23]|nr:MAG: hypothetical protein BRD19_09865 [Halobacteriales archaeon SW_7_65_23]